MSDEDLGFFYRRAEEELEMAHRAELPKVVAAHYQIASAYLERVATQERTTLSLSAPAHR
jgi:hypothetical protein